MKKIKKEKILASSLLIPLVLTPVGCSNKNNKSMEHIFDNNDDLKKETVNINKISSQVSNVIENYFNEYVNIFNKNNKINDLNKLEDDRNILYLSMGRFIINAMDYIFRNDFSKETVNSKIVLDKVYSGPFNNFGNGFCYFKVTKESNGVLIKVNANNKDTYNNYNMLIKVKVDYDFTNNEINDLKINFMNKEDDTISIDEINYDLINDKFKALSIERLKAPIDQHNQIIDDFNKGELSVKKISSYEFSKIGALKSNLPSSKNQYTYKSCLYPFTNDENVTLDSISPFYSEIYQNLSTFSLDNESFSNSEILNSIYYDGFDKAMIYGIDSTFYIPYYKDSDKNIGYKNTFIKFNDLKRYLNSIKEFAYTPNNNISDEIKSDIDNINNLVNQLNENSYYGDLGEFNNIKYSLKYYYNNEKIEKRPLYVIEKTLSNGDKKTIFSFLIENGNITNIMNSTYDENQTSLDVVIDDSLNLLQANANAFASMVDNSYHFDDPCQQVSYNTFPQFFIHFISYIFKNNINIDNTIDLDQVYSGNINEFNKRINLKVSKTPTGILIKARAYDQKNIGKVDISFNIKIDYDSSNNKISHIRINVLNNYENSKTNIINLHYDFIKDKYALLNIEGMDRGLNNDKFIKDTFNNGKMTVDFLKKYNYYNVSAIYSSLPTSIDYRLFKFFSLNSENSNNIDPIAIENLYPRLYQDLLEFPLDDTDFSNDEIKKSIELDYWNNAFIYASNKSYYIGIKKDTKFEYKNIYMDYFKFKEYLNNMLFETINSPNQLFIDHVNNINKLSENINLINYSGYLGEYDGFKYNIKFNKNPLYGYVYQLEKMEPFYIDIRSETSNFKIILNLNGTTTFVK